MPQNENPYVRNYRYFSIRQGKAKEGIFVVSDHAGKHTVVAKEDMVRLDVFMECMLDHLLFQGE